MFTSQIARLGNCFCKQSSLKNILKLTKTTGLARSPQVLNNFFHTSTSHQNAKRPSDEDSTKTNDGDDPITSYLSSKYKILSEENAPIILDLEAERKRLDVSHEEQKSDNTRFEDNQLADNIDMTRGLKGVFDVEQIVELLHSEGAIDMFVCEIPQELCYADHIVIVTGRSVRHRLALAQLVRKVFKRKMRKTDIVPRIEGDGTPNQADWLAMDLGNIILHVFARSAREKYDLESLWCLGSKHDSQSNQKSNELLDMLTNSEMYLEDLEPAEPTVDSSLKDTNK